MPSPKRNPPVPVKLKQRSRQLRREQTDAEKKLWQLLHDRQLNGAKFRRQHVIGNTILDFYCHAVKLAIELDGDQHAEPEQQAHDVRRTAFLEQEGIRVLRFWNNDVLVNERGVLQVIDEMLQSMRPSSKPSPQPSPEGRGS